MATHAAGVVIAGDKLMKISLYVDHNSNLILPSTQYDMYSSENAGLVKFDLLGLKTLTVIDKTLKRLQNKNINLDISKIDLSDKKFSHFINRRNNWIISIRERRYERGNQTNETK